MANRNHVIIGTAGHVDHGKTCLIQALTGIDTDRLKEEKKRGITIELGFAYLDLPGGETAGIIDVPGHEKFIKNMLAGAGGIDIAMMIVAADEGVMPQTIEHLEILSLLGIREGVIVITKTDQADEELCQLAVDDIKELSKGTFLEEAPVILTSAYTGAGIEELRTTLIQMATKAQQKKLKETFRMPIDRIFTLKGFGTVVTGTLIEGTLEIKKDAMLYPSREPVKIRSMQIHGVEAEQAFAGQRVAVNLPGKSKEEISRGEVLAAPDSLKVTRMADVKLRVIKSANHSVKNGSRVHLYHGSRELLCKVVLMEQDILEPGQEGYAQLRLEEEAVFKAGDRFVIRFYSPVETIGGGVIVDSCPRRHKRNRQDIVETMKLKETGDPKAVMEQYIREYGSQWIPAAHLAMQAGITSNAASNAKKALETEGKIINLAPDIYVHQTYMEILKKRMLDFLDEFHREFPLKEGMSLEEARSRMQLPPVVIQGFFTYCEEKKLIKIRDGQLSAYRFRVVRHTDDKEIYKQIVAWYMKAGFQPPSTEEVKKQFASEKRFSQVFTSMITQKTLIRLDEKHFLHKKYYEKALEGVKNLFAERGEIILGEYRDYLEISRKHAVSLLEIFDRAGITRKQGDVRVLK